MPTLPTLMPVVFLVLGLVIGLGLAWAHALAARHAAAAALARESSLCLLLGFPIRVAVPAVAMFGLALLSLWALVGGMLAFVVGQRRALARLDWQPLDQHPLDQHPLER
ncbi:MAG: hypothetical protein R6X02_02490 [Enhygromyxa sp.]